MTATDNQKSLRPEWSHRVDVGGLGRGPVTVELTASPQERKDLARRLRLQVIDTLRAKVTLEREPGSHIIHVTGTVEAAIVQSCVATAQAVEEAVIEDFEAWYSDPGEAVPIARIRQEKMSRGQREVEILPEEDDPETVVGGSIDVAELATQYLSLGINPYPHAEGVIPPEEEKTVLQVGPAEEDDHNPARRNPFAALKDWKKKQGRE